MKKSQIVKEYILKNIDNGIYQVGQMIDSEITLSEKLKISRMTVREAIRDLVEDNILEKQHGRGTFVLKQPRFKGFQCGVGFSEEMKRHGMIPSSRDVSLTEIEASEEIAQDLQIAVHTSVWNIKRIRLANDIPVAYEDEYFSKTIIPSLTLEITNHSIYEYLQKEGLEFSYVDQMLDAVIADQKISQLLDVPVNTPLIRMYIIAYLKNGMPFNCGTTYYRNDHFKLSQTVYIKKEG
ncbi:MAG: GntR family transcriptional regulator [Traorella sp.]